MAVSGLIRKAGSAQPQQQQPAASPTGPQIYQSGPNYDDFGYYGYGNGNVAGQRYTMAGDSSNTPYRSNLATDIQGKWNVGTNGVFQDYSNDSDADVRELQRLQNETSAAGAGLDQGVDFATNQAKIDALKARIGLKNQLGSSIAGNQMQEMRSEKGIRDNAFQAMDQGVQSTRQNYNNRGLLYSGMRQGGELGVKSQVASQMAGDLAGTKRDYATLADQQKAAYAAVDLDTQQQKLDLANQAFDTVSKNNIARLQAYQQMAGGVGQAAGYLYGSYGRGGQQTQTSNNAVNNNYSYGNSGIGDYSGGRSLEPLSYDQIVGR